MSTEYVFYCFAQSGNACKAVLMLNLCGAQWSPRFVDYFNQYPAVTAWLEEIKAFDRWMHPCELMPGHPLR